VLAGILALALGLFHGDARCRRLSERDSEGGAVVYEVELRAADGVEHELVIDANTGRVIRAEIDD